MQYHKHILKAQYSTFDKYIYPGIHHHHQDVTTCPSSQKSPCAKKTSQNEWLAEFYSYLPFIQVIFWGGSCLIYHILWKLFHVKQKCDLRDVTMTMFISLWTAQRLTRACGSGIGGEQVPDCTQAMETEGNSSLDVNYSKIKEQRWLKLLIWLRAERGRFQTCCSWMWWPGNIQVVFWLAIRHVALWLRRGAKVGGADFRVTWCLWQLEAQDDRRIHRAKTELRLGSWELSHLREGKRKAARRKQGEEIQGVGGLPEYHRRQTLSLTLVMPPPLFFPREAALCVWTPGPCRSRWAWPSGNSCRRWGRRGGCSIYSTSPHSWSLCAGGDLGWRHSFHQVPLLTCLCLSGSQELCVPSLQPRRAEVKA